MRRPEHTEHHGEIGGAGSARKILVIGYGNTLRGDDAAGPAVAELVAGWEQLNVTALACQQLTPELAEDISRADVVIFVDALATTIAPAGLRIERMDPAPGTSCGDTHVACPCELLRLAGEVYGARPESWIVGIPGESFDMGAGLSHSTMQHMERAVEHIQRMVLRSSAELEIHPGECSPRKRNA